MNIYVFSGLGADERAFAKLKIPPSFTLVHMSWLKPLKHETLEQYAGRMAEKIDKSSPYLLMGLSFGGLIAGEIARKHNPEQTILLSSLRTSHQKPWFYRWARFTRLYKIFPYGIFKRGNFFTYKAFGVKDKEDKILLKKIMQDTDKNFFKWAIGALLQWENQQPAKNIFHIHGSNDLLMPIKNPFPDVVIKKAGHLMVLTHASEVNEAIGKNLAMFDPKI